MAPKSLCLTTAVAPVPTFLGGSCPLGCSLSAPATGGFSVVSPQHIRYAAGSEEEKRAGGRLHGGTIAQLFVFCKGSLAGLGVGVGVAGGEGERGRMVLAWPAPSISRGIGLACAVVPPSPPSNAFGNRGHAVPPAGAAPPAPRLPSVASLRWRVWALPMLPLVTGVGGGKGGGRLARRGVERGRTTWTQETGTRFRGR